MNIMNISLLSDKKRGSEKGQISTFSKTKEISFCEKTDFGMTFYYPRAQCLSIIFKKQVYFLKYERSLCVLKARNTIFTAGELLIGFARIRSLPLNKMSQRKKTGLPQRIGPPKNFKKLRAYFSKFTESGRLVL